MRTIHTTGRTCKVLVDGANLRQPMYDAGYDGVDADALRRWAGAYGRPTIHWFQGRGLSTDPFFNRLRVSGIKVHTKSPKRLPNGQLKADMDAELIVTALTTADTDTVVLISGDGDFEPLITELERRGTRIVVVANPDYLAPELSQHAEPEDLISLDALLADCGFTRWTSAA